MRPGLRPGSYAFSVADLLTGVRRYTWAGTVQLRADDSRGSRPSGKGRYRSVSHAMFDVEAEYARVEAALRDSIRGLEGRRLRDVLLQIVEPDINMVILRFEDALYVVYPWCGGDLVQLVSWEKELPTDLGPGAWYQPFDEAVPCHGCSVTQARAVGGTSNGHGIEISFSGAVDRTLIIQSIEAGDMPEGFSDCLRVGITRYTHRCVREADA